jgi:hypothetical protein
MGFVELLILGVVVFLVAKASGRMRLEPPPRGHGPHRNLPGMRPIGGPAGPHGASRTWIGIALVIGSALLCLMSFRGGAKPAMLFAGLAVVITFVVIASRRNRRQVMAVPPARRPVEPARMAPQLAVERPRPAPPQPRPAPAVAPVAALRPPLRPIPPVPRLYSASPRPSSGGSWMSAFAQTVAMVAFFAVGTGILLISSGEVSGTHPFPPSLPSDADLEFPISSHFTLASQKSRDSSDNGSHEDDHGSSQAQVSTRHPNWVDDPSSATFGGSKPSSFLGGQSEWFGFKGGQTTTVEGAENEALGRVGLFLANVVQREHGTKVGSWAPSDTWIVRNLEPIGVVKDLTTPESGPRYQGEVEIELTDNRVQQICELYRDERVSSRMRGVTQVFAGAVFLLGGLSIFLRLGTSKRVPVPAG